MKTDRLALVAFAGAVLGASFATGVVAEHFDIFPLPWLKSSVTALDEVLTATGVALPWYYSPVTSEEPVTVLDAERMAPGLTMYSNMGPDERTRVTVVDAHGRVVHEWTPDWFEIWPDPAHVPEDARPRVQEAGFVHGIKLLSDGDLVFNFEGLSAVRLDACGAVKWKMPYRAHHSVELDNAGNLWIPGLYNRTDSVGLPPNHVPPVNDYTLMRISPAGELLEEVHVFDLLREAGLEGLLHLSSIAPRSTQVGGDTMHLNDIEVFPAGLGSGVFEPGDVMISLRNINTVLVFDPDDWSLKFKSVGAVLRQHDPDFVDGNTISIFDNRNLLAPGDWNELQLPPDVEGASRVVTLSALTGEVTTLYEGTEAAPLFTPGLGQHQLLSNGNILIAESIRGRVVEVDRRGEIVWEFWNILDDHIKGFVPDAVRLPPEYDESFFAARRAACGAAGP